jgi:hypothetical protein
MIDVQVKRIKKHNATKGTIEGIEKAMKEFIIGVESQAKAFAPVDTGFLRASIRNRVINKIANITGVVFTKVKYAIHNSKLGRNAANGGQGFLSPALNKMRTKVTAIFGRNVRSEIRRS